MVEPQMGGWGATATRDGNSAMVSSRPWRDLQLSRGDRRGALWLLLPAAVAQRRGRRRRPSSRRARPRQANFAIGGAETEISLGYWSAPPAEGCGGWRAARRARRNRVEIDRRDGGREIHALASGLPLARGDIVRIVTAQGGGWGTPDPVHRYGSDSTGLSSRKPAMGGALLSIASTLRIMADVCWRYHTAASHEAICRRNRPTASSSGICARAL